MTFMRLVSIYESGSSFYQCKDVQLQLVFQGGMRLCGARVTIIRR